MYEQNKYNKQIEIIDLVYKSLKNQNADDFFKVRDGLYFAFFKSAYDLKDDFKELIPYQQAGYVFQTLNVIQKAASFGNSVLFGCAGSINIRDALEGLDFIKGILTSAFNTLIRSDEESNNNITPPGDINSNDENNLPLLIRDLLLVCRRMQENYYYANKNVPENMRNTEIRNGMRYLDYVVDDQTLQGQSAKGNAPGEVDLLIKEKNTTKKIVVEGLNLSGLDTSYIEEHFDRVFRYDTYGNKYNVELVYCNVNDLDDMQSKYIDTIKNYKKASHPADRVEEIQSDSSRLFILRSHQLINKKDNFIFHLLIQLSAK